MKHRNKKIDFLLLTATKVFYFQGFHGTKMEHVAKEAGVSKGVLYFYFKNKEDLFMALIHYSLLKIHEYTLQILNAVKNQKANEQIVAFLNFYFKLIEDYPELQYPISEYISMSHPSRQVGCETGITSGMRESKYYEEVLLAQFLTTSLLVGLIEKGQKEGSILNQTDAKIIFANLWSMMLGYEKLSVADSYFKDIITESFSDFHIDRLLWQKNIIETIKNILNQTT
ncbi:MAG: TetR/AcrR family transcriptional regulator [Chitinophagales bacterium]|nr:TetR/AcrR family transcriptional regulator [Chitinophagales bacterium]MCZ2394587.1 TetR/AcrR family transcriptional regulator [Chitinophagales bacterium]